MPEGQSHKRAKSKAAGKTGRTEVKISGGRRLDAATQRRAVEVETSGSIQRLGKAASRLKDSRRSQHVLVVPERDFPKARQAMKRVGVSGTLRNLTGTKRASVSVHKGSKRAASSRGKSSRR